MTSAALPRPQARILRLAALFGVTALGFALSGCGSSSGNGDASGAAAGSTSNVAGGGSNAGAAGNAALNVAGSAQAGSLGSAGGAGTEMSVGGTSGSSAVGGTSGSTQGGAGANAGGAAGANAGGSSHGGAGTNAGGSGSAGTGGMPSTPATKIVGGYYPNWTPAPPRLRDVEAHYNLIYLFAAKPVGGAPGTTGAVSFDLPGDGNGAKTHFNEDLAYARATQKRKVILSVGGAGAGMSFPNRQKSQTFVDSIGALYTTLGGFDGMDWNTFEADQNPDTNEMIWISLELKKNHPGFIVSAPPAPWNARDKTFCAAMVKAGALDYAAPQYYDGPNLATQSYITTSVAEWVKLLGADKVVVGFGIWNQPNYMNIADAVATWKAVAQANPTLRGAFDWQIFTDQDQGWPFAKQLGPLVMP